VNGYDAITTDKPERSLIAPIKNSGVNSRKDDHALYGWWSQAEIVIDFKRTKEGIPATVKQLNMIQIVLHLSHY
jgi:large subunit ribosomal protein L2